MRLGDFPGSQLNDGRCHAVSRSLNIDLSVLANQGSYPRPAGERVGDHELELAASRADQLAAALDRDLRVQDAEFAELLNDGVAETRLEPVVAACHGWTRLHRLVTSSRAPG
jgi:hypothetical protein